ncbi:hypothetical protein OJ252_1330 [Cryptosporidium canis]|uniref:Adaptor complexes medium subunit family protein n=1 Tax=Cryptosporidium canis TaxID=195482 RepID=A0ABQ8P8I2_9CRYT|nr:hypothetical protein OJ252_1330 [Cryptosporidium canis]
MTYIRGIWLFSNGTRSGSLEIVLSKRFSSVEKRLERLLEEDFVGIPNDKDILEWFESRIVFENVDRFTAARLQDTFTEASLGVFSIDNLSVSVGSDRRLDKERLASISETNLLHFMRVGEERYLWPFMHSYSRGSYMLMLLSLETSISEDHSLLTVYRSRSRSIPKDADSLAAGLVEVRVGVQLLEDLMELVGGGQDGEAPEAGKVLQAWRTFIPFGCPVMDRGDVGDSVSLSRNKGVPDFLTSLLSDNSKQSCRILEGLMRDGERPSLQGSFYQDSVASLLKEQQLIQDMDAELSLNEEFIPMIPNGVSKSPLVLGDMLNLGIGRLSSKTRGSVAKSSQSYSIKFSLAEVICCSARSHPISTQIETTSSIIDGTESMKNFIEKIGAPYASFTSGSLEFSGKLPNSVSISCNIIIPWQRVVLASGDKGCRETAYIQPYVSTQDSILCTKLADELLDSSRKTLEPIRPGSEVLQDLEETKRPVSRFKLSWNSWQNSNSCRILTYWYPYEQDVPIKGYFTISPESKEPVRQITQSQGHFRPILTHSFRMEYCLCFDPAIIEGMQICQIVIPLLPGTMETISGQEGTSSTGRQSIPSVMIFDQSLKPSMGQITISGDKRSIIWTIHNPGEVLGGAGSNKKFPFIQLRMHGNVKLRIIYKESKKPRSGGHFPHTQTQAFSSPAINSYILNIGLESGVPNWSRRFLEETGAEAPGSFLYSAPDPFGDGIQPLLSCPLREIDPILLIELHPKIAKLAENSKRLSQREIYSHLIELIFPYSYLSFSVHSEEATYRGVSIPAGSISINPKALLFDQPEVVSSSGKYIIWRNTSA